MAPPSRPCCPDARHPSGGVCQGIRSMAANEAWSRASAATRQTAWRGAAYRRITPVGYPVAVVEARIVLASGHPQVTRVEQGERRMVVQPLKLEAREHDSLVRHTTTRGA